MQFKKRRGFFQLTVLEVSIQSWLSDFGPVTEKSWWEHGLSKLFTSQPRSIKREKGKIGISQFLSKTYPSDLKFPTNPTSRFYHIPL